MTATKTRTKRPGWCVTFRHPVRNDSRNKPGLKIRRGLGTTDEQEAERLVEQLNQLLGDKKGGLLIVNNMHLQYLIVRL